MKLENALSDFLKNTSQTSLEIRLAESRLSELLFELLSRGLIHDVIRAECDLVTAPVSPKIAPVVEVCHIDVRRDHIGFSQQTREQLYCLRKSLVYSYRDKILIKTSVGVIWGNFIRHMLHGRCHAFPHHIFYASIEPCIKIRVVVHFRNFLARQFQHAPESPLRYRALKRIPHYCDNLANFRIKLSN
jgi:hypothetical protein